MGNIHYFQTNPFRGSPHLGEFTRKSLRLRGEEDSFSLAVADCHRYDIPYIYIYIHTCIHTYLHYIRLHDIALHYITLHYITLHCITLHYITLQYIHTYTNAY